jgi:predicted nucleic acid-binding protein
LLNLYATRRLEVIASQLTITFLVTPWVSQKEALFVFERQGMTQGARVPVDLTAAVSSNSLVLDAELSTDDELAMLVELSFEVDQGEAETIAAVMCRGGGLVTDDGKAMKAIASRSPDTPVITSVGLIRRWAESVGIQREALREVLLDMQLGGNFIPGRREPHLAWWNSIFEDE